jgi:tetratricopeptide (TPR) repeat protein
MSAAALAPLPASVRESTIVKALIGYSSGCWLLLQIVSTFIQGLGLPDWVFTGFLMILLAGLPVLLYAVHSSGRAREAGKANQRQWRLGRLSFRKAALGGSALIGGWIVIVALFMASWAFGIGPAGSLLAAGSLDASDSVLIAEFDNRTTDPMLAGTVAEAIRVDLSQSNIIRVVERADVGEALERMKKPSETPLNAATARDLAVREGIAAVLEGQVSSLGPATIIVVRLVDAQSGQKLAEYEETARAPSELLDAVDRLSGTLRNKIGEPLTKIRVEPPLAKVTTTSVAALREYTRANAAHGAGDKKKAAELLRSAVTLDPMFPMAWRKLGVLLADSNPVEARNAYTRAYELRDNLPERERALATASYFKNVRNDLPQAMAVYQRLLAIYPDDEVALNNLANLYTAFQQPEHAVALQQKVVALHPRFAAYSNLFNGQVRLGKIADARHTHDIAARLFPDQKKVKFQPIELAIAAGDYEGADRLVSSLLAQAKPELANDLFIARYAVRRGRLDQARAIFRERARVAADKGKYGDAIESMTSVVAIARAEGKQDEGRALLAEALASFPLDKVDPQDRPYLDLAEAYALVGDAGSAARYLKLADSQGPTDGMLNYDQRARTKGLIALAMNQPGKAVAILEKASRFGQCSTCVLFDLGMAQEAAGQPQQAMATYAHYRQLSAFALGRGELLGFALARLAALQAQVGDQASAADTRQALDALWRRADAPLLAAHATPVPKAL